MESVLDSKLQEGGVESKGDDAVSIDMVVENGAYLTWEDLWVTVPHGKKSTKPILQGLTGVARPGQLLAIMGPSGCGKSIFLDALGGRLNSKMTQTGEILINGRKEILAYGTSAYVTQDDTLIATLTVCEAVYYSAQLRLPDSMSKSEKKERAEITIREMGLQDAMNTRIGGCGDKGLSGGQKRRVSICIEILTRPKLLFLDEPTIGLDSAASYYVMNKIACLAKKMTIIASIHQPSSEIFQLFHDLCLLSSGKTIYFGPASLANEFFTSSGFPCPTLKNPSDHFLKIMNEDFDQYIDEEGLVETISTKEAINSLLKPYKASKTYEQVRRQVAEICKQNCEALEKKKNHASFLTQSIILTKRSFINMYPNPGYYWMRLVVYITLALGLGTIYYNIGFTYESIQARGSLLTFIASFLTFITVGGFPYFVEDMKVYERERLNGHYGATAFVMGNTFSSLPYLLIISVIPGAISYYLPGLQKGYQHFLYFVCVLFACLMLVESLMMIIASLVSNYLLGIITGAGVQALMILGGGIFRLPRDLPDYFWRYPLYYMAFHKDAFQGMFKNEFQGLVIFNDQVGSGQTTISGVEILKDKWQVEKGYSKWVDLAVLLGMALLYRILFLVIIKIKEKTKPGKLTFMVVPPKQIVQMVENPI